MDLRKLYVSMIARLLRLKQLDQAVLSRSFLFIADKQYRLKTVKMLIKDSKNGSINNIPFGTPVDAFVKDILVPYGASYKIYESDELKRDQSKNIVSD